MTTPILLAVLAGLASAQPVALESAHAPAAELLRAVPRAAVPGAPASADMSALQKHVAFFDMDGNGLITRFETVLSLQRLGMGSVKATAAALFIHVALVPATTRRWGSWTSVRTSRAAGTAATPASTTWTGVSCRRLRALRRVRRQPLRVVCDGDPGDDRANSAAPGSESASKAEFQLLLPAGDMTEDAGGRSVPLSRTRQDFYDGSLLQARQGRAHAPDPELPCAGRRL